LLKAPAIPQQLRLVELIRNYHFWIIIGLIAGVVFVYNDWFWRYDWFWLFCHWEFRNDIIGTLLFIPFLYATVVFGLRGAIIVWLLSLIAILPYMVTFSFTTAPLMRNIGTAFLPLLAIITVILEVNWRNRQKQIIVEREAERHLYITQILKAQEDERGRVAQELHDGTIQDLLVFANKIQGLIESKANEDGGKSETTLQHLRDSILDLTEDLRRITLDLRPSVLDNLGLVPAVRWLVQKLTKESKTTAKVSINGVKRKLSSESEVIVFRIIQEALNNVQRHSGATEVIIDLLYAPDYLRVIVKDNGIGFYISKTQNNLVTERMGIMGIRQRVNSLNGSINITSQVGIGTSLSFRVPC